MVRKIRFVHIPKTAGTSFFNCLRRLYRGAAFIMSSDLKSDLRHLGKLDPAERQKIVLFSGHSPRHTGVPEIDALPTITFLREPVSRVKSFCQHVSEGKSPHLLERFPPESFDLDQFLESGDVELDNLQTRLLLGAGDWRLPDAPPDLLVERAVSVLTDDLAGYGVVEHFDESLMLFRHRLGWDWPVYRRMNTKDESRLIEFGPRHIEKIRALNAIDIAMYDAAVAIFRERRLGNAGEIEECLEKFRPRQKLFEMRSRAVAKVRHARDFFRTRVKV